MRNTSDEEIDAIAAQFKGEGAPAEETPSSLTNEEESTEPTAESTPEVPPVGPVEEKQEAPKQEPPAQEKSTGIDPQEYETLKKELEELKGKKHVPDVSWFATPEGKLYTRDLDSINLDTDAAKLVTEKLIEDGYTREEAEEEVDHRFEVLFDRDAEEDSDEYRAALRNIKKEARIYLTGLRERKAKLEVPFKESSEEGQIAKEELPKLFEEQYKKSYQQRATVRSQMADELVKERQKSTLKFGENIEIEYELSKEVSQKVKDLLTDIENIGSRYVKGKDVQTDELFKALVLLADGPTIIKSYADKKAAEGKEELVKNELKNTNFEKTAKNKEAFAIDESDPHYKEVMALRNGK